jgi:hypothetical protein
MRAGLAEALVINHCGEHFLKMLFAVLHMIVLILGLTTMDAANLDRQGKRTLYMLLFFGTTYITLENRYWGYHYWPQGNVGENDSLELNMAVQEGTPREQAISSNFQIMQFVVKFLISFARGEQFALLNTSYDVAQILEVTAEDGTTHLVEKKEEEPEQPEKRDSRVVRGLRRVGLVGLAAALANSEDVIIDMCEEGINHV